MKKNEKIETLNIRAFFFLQVLLGYVCEQIKSPTSQPANVTLAIFIFFINFFPFYE